MSIHDRIAVQALMLVGVPFRLHGRCEMTGLDCVGLAALAVARAGGPVAALPGYQLRGTRVASAVRALQAAGFAPVEEVSPGALLLADSGPMQLHLMVGTARGLVHADAGLGRVVLMPFPAPWPILGRWRLNMSSQQG